jgi:glycosyltransferase involved in cell wall biosynthesis
MPNGINREQLPVRDDRRFDGCSVAYVGTLYVNRNLTSVLAAMRAIRQDRADGAKDLKLRIAGPMDMRHRNKFHADLAADGIVDLVENRGVVPRAQALDLLNQSHLALVLAQDQPMCIPAKLYECMGLGVPTLVIAEDSSASAREGRRIGAMVVEPDDVEGIRRIFEDALAGRLPATVVPAAAIAYSDLAGDMDRLIRSELA